MIKRLFILLLSLFFASQADAISILKQDVALSCGASPFISQTDTSGTGEYMNDTHSQKVKYATAIQICKVTVHLNNYGSACSPAIEFWTASLKGSGTQIGGESTPTSIPTGEDWRTFTWSSNYPSPTADYFLHFDIKDCSPTAVIWQMSTLPTAYEDTNYDFFNDGVDGDKDAAFTIYKLE